MDNEKEFIDELKDRLEQLKTERAKRENDWKEVQELVAASVYSWDNPLDKKPQRPKRYTSRPTNFLKTLRSGITGYSVSPNIAWIKLGLENREDENIHGAKDWIEGIEKTLYAEFNRSNLYRQIAKFVEFAATCGHAVMLVDEQIGDGMIRFTNLNLQELYLDINEYDEVDTVFRRYSMTLKNAASFFGEKGLSPVRREDLKDKKKWGNEIEIIHAVYRRKEFGARTDASTNMPYASVYIEEGRDHLLKESGYSEFPYSVFIWDPVNGTAYGESPAIQALDDIRLLNIIDESRIKIAQLAADPAYNVPESMKGPPSVVPAGYNYYSKPNEIVIPIDTGKNYPITLETHKDIENRVKDWFYVDFFLSLMGNRPGERPGDMTATYVMELQGEKAAALSDLVVNINGALTKIIRRSFNILWKQGKIEPPPDGLSGTGARLKIDFMGPLAQAQRKYHEYAGISGGINLIGAVARMSPASMDVVDFDAVLKEGLTGQGFPQTGIREDRDIEAMRRMRAEQEARMRQQQEAQAAQEAVLGNMDKLNKPVEQGSVLASMGQMQQGGVQ